MPIDIVKFDASSISLLRKFVNFDKVLYKNDTNYIVPIKMSLLGNRLLGAKGLLRDNHLFHSHSEIKYFLALDGKDVLGRLAVCINDNYNKYHKQRVASFGFFETIEDYSITKLLFDKAISWLNGKGVTEIKGPLNFSSNDTLGLLIEGFEYKPFVNTTYNKQYYSIFLERYGFSKEKDLIGQLLPVKKDERNSKRHKRLDKIVDRIKKKYDIKTRGINLGKGFTDEIKLMHKLYLGAWRDNWGFVPLTEEEMLLAAEDMRTIADKELVRFAYIGNKPAGFIGCLPDVNEIVGNSKDFLNVSDYIRVIKILLRQRKAKRVRLMLFGLLEEYKKMGIDAILYHECFKYAQENTNYEECEISWLLEDNHLVIRAGESMYAKQYKKWRVYSLSLSLS